MKTFSTVSKRSLVILAALAFAVAVSSTSAFAVPKAQVLRVSDGSNHTGRCCSSWEDAVQVNEPDRVVPVVVTWSTEYQTDKPFLAGFSLNGGPCTFSGPKSIPPFNPGDWTMSTITFQWVIMPGDYGLVPGRNVIRLCGGGVFSDTDTINFGFGTLAARLGK